MHNFEFLLHMHITTCIFPLCTVSIIIIVIYRNKDDKFDFFTRKLLSL